MLKGYIGWKNNEESVSVIIVRNYTCYNSKQAGV